MLCLATMHIRQGCSTCDRQLACYCVKYFQLRHCTAESPLQQATEAAAKKQADADKPQAAAAAAADKPQAAATPGAITFETEATPSAQGGPGEAPLLQEHLCKECCIATDVTYTRQTMASPIACFLCLC